MANPPLKTLARRATRESETAAAWFGFSSGDTARAPPDQRRWRSSISKGGICPEAVLHDNGSEGNLLDVGALGYSATCYGSSCRRSCAGAAAHGGQLRRLAFEEFG